MLIFSVLCLNSLISDPGKKNINTSQVFCDENCLDQLSENILWLLEIYHHSGRRTPVSIIASFISRRV